MPDYPHHLVHTCALANGSVVTIRPIRPADTEMVQDFVRHLSQESRYSRFMSQLQELSENKLKYFTEIDYHRHLALIATVIADGKEIEVGVARHVGLAQTDNCEFAIAVDDDWHGSGVAGILMQDLLAAARERGFRQIEGSVLATNQTMLNFVRRLGFAVQLDPEDSTTMRVVRSL